MIGCGPILGKGLSAAHPSRIGDWDFSPISLPTGIPLGVNRVTLTVGRLLSVYRDQRTSSDRPDMSGW
jgi:hypothetical protein